jgi:alpha-ketoglutarate-dependent taurine dioxygenase
MPASYLDVVELVQGETTTPIEAWVDRNLSELRGKLQARGAVLLRGFRAEADTVAQQVLSVVGHELLDDAFWSTPRTGVSAKTFTATEYPKERTIALHSEMAYMTAWPRLVAFHALVVASRGGETTICDVDAVSRELGDILEPFQRLGVRYRRNYHPGVDVPWQKAFRTTDPAEVAATAQRVGMNVRWLDEDTLQTVHNAQGCVTDEAGHPLWFSQAHVFHRSNIPPSQLAMLIELFGDESLPRDALYGDGTPIPDEVVRRVNDTFSRLALGVAWQPGDVLLLDNMRFAHGRLPFEGARKLHVALANQQSVRARTPLFGAH